MSRPHRSTVADAEALRGLLGRIDGRGYKAYKELRGAYALGACTLQVDHVQGDPFAAPSRMRVRLAAEEAGLPAALFANRTRRIAVSYTHLTLPTNREV